MTLRSKLGPQRVNLSINSGYIPMVMPIPKKQAQMNFLASSHQHGP